MEKFLKYNEIYAGQTPKTADKFLEIIKDYETIIEIGFHRGGFSEWLDAHKSENSKLYCFDITKNFLQSNKNLNFIISDCFNYNTIITIQNIINNGGKTLLLCDGGLKEKEFEVFSSLIKVNDVIMLHDYCHSVEEYDFFASDVNWPSPPESFYDNIKDIVNINNLKPFRYEEFKSVFWGSFIKEEKILLSILVGSLIERKDTFLTKLLDNLYYQTINKPVEVIVFTDNAKRPIGTKRNNLLNLANGEYVCFIDDDDRISDDYVDNILKEINEWYPDVVVFNAEITFNGERPKLVRYGREYDYCEKQDAYYRHPNHLMVHKKSNITEFYKDVKTGEDDEWAARMLPRIVTQSRIDKIMYYYDFNTNTKKYFT